MSLQDAVDVLDEQAAGLPLSDRSRLAAAVLALETVTITAYDRNLLDAVAELQRMANGGELTRNQAGREHAAHLASIVSGLINRKSKLPR